MTELSSTREPLVGRDDLLEELGAALAPGAVVTLTGAPGAGKSRLAAHAAKDHQGRVYHVDLSEAASVDDARRALARRLGVKPASVDEHLASVPGALLLLDNAEHLTAFLARAVAVWLVAAPEVAILVTSREALGIAGERAVEVGPLDTKSAERLFLDRAGLGPSVSDVVRAEIAEIAERLDRLPLAIELAAARARVAGTGELLRRVSETLEVLRGVRRDVASRHASLTAALDASWALLSDAEKNVLCTLSLFRGGASLGAVLDVSEDAGALEHVESLVRRSLAQRRFDPERGTTRFSLLATVRLYVAAKDFARGRLEERHAVHFLGEIVRLSLRTYGRHAEEALLDLAREAENVLAAHERSRASDPARAAQLVVGLSDLVFVPGAIDLAGGFFTSAVEAADRAGDPALLARARHARGRAATLETGTIAAAVQDLEAALEAAGAAEAAGAGPELAADVRRSLGWALAASGEMDRGWIELTRALATHREHRQARGIADALAALGVIARLGGDADAALPLLHEAFDVHVREGDVIRQRRVLELVVLAGHDAARFLSMFPGAAVTLDDTTPSREEGYRGRGQRWRAAIEAYQLGSLAHAAGDVDRALVDSDRAARAFEEAGVTQGLAVARARSAAVLAEKGLFAEADLTFERAARAAEAQPETLFATREIQRTLRGFVEAARAAAAHDAHALSLAEEILRETRARETTFGGGSLLPLLAPRVAAARAVAARPQAEIRPIRVTEEARSLALPDGPEPIDLVRHGALRRVLDALVTARLERPGDALTVDDLIRLGWPGERALHQAATLRVYTAVRRLRKLGLADVLVTRDDGYLLDPEVPLVRDA